LDALRFSQQNSRLNSLDRDFANLNEKAMVDIFRKELVDDNFIISKRLLGRAQIAPQWLGGNYFGEAVKVPHSDHITIAKPVDSRAFQHRVLVEFVRSAVDYEEEHGRSRPVEIEAGAARAAEERLSSKTANNPVIIQWPQAVAEPSHPRGEDGSRRLKLYVIAATGCLGAVVAGSIGLNALSDYRFQRALLDAGRRTVLRGITSWDKIPSSLQQPVARGLSDYELALALTDKGVLRLDGSEILVGTPGSRTQASLYVHTLELYWNSTIVTNGNNLTIVTARVISENGKILSFLPRDLTSRRTGAAGLAGGVLRFASLTTINGPMIISLPGQNGAPGQAGDKGEPGAAGSRGSDAVRGAFGCGAGR
jgi:hypothetical protein